MLRSVIKDEYKNVIISSLSGTVSGLRKKWAEVENAVGEKVSKAIMIRLFQKIFLRLRIKNFGNKMHVGYFHILKYGTNSRVLRTGFNLCAHLYFDDSITRPLGIRLCNQDELLRKVAIPAKWVMCVFYSGGYLACIGL